MEGLDAQVARAHRDHLDPDFNASSEPLEASFAEYAEIDPEGANAVDVEFASENATEIYEAMRDPDRKALNRLLMRWAEARDTAAEKWGEDHQAEIKQYQEV